MNECDHIVGYHRLNDSFFRKSDELDFSESCIPFKFCPDCGEKLDERV